ncbi:TorF family putative porin [Methylophaga sp. OBS4]|uniref:TorF family putative porin n=1 Tax=Methylophaga sp. OBS4 TaxID=2991935 RepID=UPI00225B353C|nr:TorF family putative porin [Methylophaga sp. OBS4]MCX4186590.1 TorF family putative porin [Methylophaga sp. OBS4]
MNLSKISALCFAATTLFAASSAMAWESADGAHSTSASVALGSDYMWRGYSQTDNEPAISGSFDYGHSSGFYAGTWASNVDFALGDDQAHIEVDVYAGFANEIGDTGIGYDLGVLRFIYPGTDGGDWNEVYGSLSYSYFSIGVAHSSDVYGSSEKGTYYSAGFDYDLPYGLALSAGLGYYDYDEDVFGPDAEDSATDYRIGLSKEFVGFGFDLTYTDTDSDGEELYGDNIADGRLVFTVSKSM